jgi:hypothetical protein
MKTITSRRSFGASLVVALCAALMPQLAAAATAYDPFFATQSTAADLGLATRPFGVAAGDYDGDGKADLVVGRTTGNVHFSKGNGDGTFQAPTQFAWKQAFFNAWAFTPADVNGDNKLDVVWGASALSTGCSVSPAPSPCPTPVTVADGDVRAFLGNGDGTFQENTYFVSGVRHNAGVPVGNVGVDAGSLAAGDVDGDGDADVVAGGVSGTNSIVRIFRNGGTGTFTADAPLISQPTACATPCSPIYFPAITTQNSPWGLATGDADADGDTDLWVGDRALYVYLFKNNGTGTFTMQTGNSAVAGRGNVYLGHDSVRAAVGFTPSLVSSDMNGDGKADLVLGLQSGTQTPASNTANDGALVLNVSDGTTHRRFGTLADVGTMARGLNSADVNGDGARDLIAAEYDGKIKVLRQLTPIDSDSDGVSDYVDNAPNHPNAARIDMNDDGSLNYNDQLDNDFDTILGDPENQASWQRLGDPADDDDDNDGVNDGADNCAFVANGGQTDADGDGTGDGCDPLDDRDTDGDGVPDGPEPGDPLYDESLAAKAKYASGDTQFIIRVDALGRLFQNEFTQLMTDAASLTPAEWAAKCWQNYDPGDAPSTSTPDPTYEPCGTGEGTAGQTLTLDGGRDLPVSLVTIPKQLWTDAPVITWINDRNDSANFDLGQHGSYHDTNTGLGDWADDTDGRAVFSCETCGLTEAENFELLKVGYDTLMGNYSNKWIVDSGGDVGDPKIDWSSAANPLISYAPPFNASDTLSRKATAMLGYKSFSASINEELGYAGYPTNFFSPEGSHHEQFDQFGMFHASADHEVEPPETAGGSYNTTEYADYLASVTEDGGLNTWLIEEVEWSGRPCNDDERVTGPTRAPAPVTCAEGIAMGAPNNRENNTVYGPRWDGWMQLLDYIKNYEGGVAMTMGEIALAKGFDNAPTVPNPAQADADADGIGDAIDGASLNVANVSLSRNTTGNLSATLTNGGGDPIADQPVEFSFDADGDGTDETYNATTNASGVAQSSVTATRAVGSYGYTATWDGGKGVTANDNGTADVADQTTTTLDATNPSSGQTTDAVSVGATLVDSDGAPLEGRTITFSVGTATANGTTDAAGHATGSVTLGGPARSDTLTASFEGAGSHGSSSDTAAFSVTKENTTLSLADAVSTRSQPAVARATLTEADGAPLASRTVTFLVQQKVRNQLTYQQLGTATTNAAGVASFTVPTKYVTKTPTPIRATFAEDASFLGSVGNASARKA